MSYGNTKNVFEFRDGLVWLSGDNGFGKSAIVEAMTFALLGVSYRGGKKEELRNSRNAEDGAPTTVILTFDTENPQDGRLSYRVTRSITGKASTVKFVIEKKEGEDWVVQNKRAGFSQQDFEQKVLQFNEVLFKNVIAMNTQETLPFFLLPPAKKRELLESIISLSLDTWKKENNKRLSEANLEFTVALSEISQLKNEIVELNEIYTQMQEERSRNIEQMKIDYANASERSLNINSQLNEFIDKRTACKNDLDSLKEAISEEPTIDRRIEQLNNTMRGVSQLSGASEQLKVAQKEYDELTASTAKESEEAADAQQKLSVLREDVHTMKGELHDMERRLSAKTTELDMKTKLRDDITAQATSFKVGTPCPTCGHISDESDVERHKSELRKKWTEANENVKVLKTQVQALNDEISQCTSSIQDSESKIGEYMDIVDNYDATILPLLQKASGALSSAKAAYNKYSVMSDGFDMDAAQAEISQLEAKKAEIQALRETYYTKQDEFNEIVSAIGDLNGQLDHERSEMDRLASEIEQAKSATDDAVASMKSKIEKNQSLLLASYDKQKHASRTKMLCDVITKICADDGMKQMVFSMFVPVFNEAVAHNLSKAGLPFTVTFSDSMEFTYQSYPGGAPSYKMLSQGQHRKLDFAVAMAFRDFVSLLGSFRVNFLSLDEVLDISTDDNAMRDMLDLVKSMLDDIGCAVVITHRGKVVADKFDYKQDVTNNGMYSMLGPTKSMWTQPNN